MNKYRCIVVEDETLVRNSLIRKIEQLEMNIQVIDYAADGNSAMQKSEATLPNFVITDIRIPGMDGLELMQWLYFTYPSIPFLITSGYAEFQYAQAAIHYNAVDYLLKPISIETLRKGMNNIILRCDTIAEQIMPPTMNHESPEELVDIIKEYILFHYRENFTLENIIEKTHYSPAYLSRIFRKATSQTPLQYLISLRIREAKRLLIADKNIPVGTIGNMVGYDDVYYFSRIFRKYAGVYPLEFRKSFSEQE